MESMAVLLVFFIIGTIIALLFITNSRYKAQQDIDESHERESIAVAQLVASLPELQCSNQNIINDNCFDIEKLDAFKEKRIQLEPTYYPLFYYSTINITQIYPTPPSGEGIWTIYDRSNNKGYTSTTFPISLKDPITRRNAFGLVTVKTYAP